MDWKQILSLSVDELTDLKRDEIYDGLMQLKREHLDRKHYKKLIDLMQHILRYKGDMVITLLTELEGVSAKDLPQINSELLLAENAGLKEIIVKLEADKSKLKLRIQELCEENVLAQRRNQDTSTIGAGSDRDDSPNLLSEIDKQEELLLNISKKNKHIKRLLREIETFEADSIKSTQHIKLLEHSLAEATQQVSVLGNQLDEHTRKIGDQDSIIDELHLSVQNLSDQLGVMEAERNERELDIHEFGIRLEKRARHWRQLLEEKDDRLDSLRAKYETVLETNPGYDIDADRVGLQQMAEAVAARDSIIAELENKISGLSQDMIETTQLLNSLSREREVTGYISSARQESVCTQCTANQVKLDNCTARFDDLQAIVHSLEEDNLLKSRQTLEAQRALALLRSGEEGLSTALTRNIELQSKIESRDKHVRSLIAELNILQQAVQENEVLRQRLGIDDDELVSTTALVTRERKNEEITKRLKLKLRASEEIRLQLKLDKNYLKRELSDLKQHNSGINIASNEKTDIVLTEPHSVTRQHTASTEELEEKYVIVVEENENLRIGMHEILEQLRNYEAQADHIVIDTTTLEKLLHALDARSVSGWYHPAMRLQNELIASKEREVALMQRLRVVDKSTQNVVLSSSRQHTDQECQTIDTADNVEPRTNTSWDWVFNQFTTKDEQIQRLSTDFKRLTEEHRLALVKLESFAETESQFDDLTKMLATSDDEQHVRIAVHCENVLQLTNKYNKESRKHQFVQEDLDQLKAQHKSLIEYHNSMMYEFRKQLLNCEILNPPDLANRATCNDQLTEDLQTELAYIKAKMVRTSASALSKFVDLESITNIDLKALHKKGVIQEDLTISYLTQTEFDQLAKKCKEYEQQNIDLLNNRKKLDELLRLAESQINILQRELNERSEDEIAARHLIVDLQSQGQGQYLIAKMGRDLKQAHQSEESLKHQLQGIQSKCEQQTSIISSQMEYITELKRQTDQILGQNEFKLRFITKSYEDMRQQFQNTTPLYPLVDFVKDYADLLQIKEEMQSSHLANELHVSETVLAEICQRVEQTLGHHAIEDKLQIIKYETHQVYLEEKLRRITTYYNSVQQELDELKLRSADWSQHWDTIQLLFGNDKPSVSCVAQSTSKVSQTIIETLDNSTNTDQRELQTEDKSVSTIEPHVKPVAIDPPTPTPPVPQAAPRQTAPIAMPNNDDLSLASQLKQAMYLASTRSALLLEHENRLAVAHARVKTLERIIQERDNAPDTNGNALQSPRQDENVLSATIASLQSLLQEKEAALLRQQEAIRNERQTMVCAHEEHRKGVKLLQAQIDELREQAQLKAESKVSEDSTKEFANQSMSDALVDEMFLEDGSDPYDVFHSSAAELIELQKKVQDSEDEARKLHARLREVSMRESGWERTMCEKDKDIEELRQRIHKLELNEHDLSNASNNRRDIEQLREMLDEKDRHINDLTDTLTSFHDDQQKFINDTSLHTADQVSQLSADLSRFETTNRILSTQLDALKRQLTSVGQREQQAREMIKTLKNQLIRRPVISMKSATDTRSTSSREEHLQKRVHQLDNDLLQTREELRKQTLAAQCKRNKDASDLGLWSKQKRFQQMADALKEKLADRENEFDKLKSHLATSKAVITRLEREKNILNDRLGRSVQQQRFCQYPSCPSLHLSSAKPLVGESPDSCAASHQHGADFRYANQMGKPPDSARSKPTSSGGANQLDISDNNQDIIEAQHSRIEAQQRKLVAMEFEGRGNTAMCHELERLQERLSTIEAQNLRLEAKNLHLQLNNDIMQQGDQSEKTQRQIKYLEDYIITLKSELAQTQSQIVAATDVRITAPSSSHSSLEHTHHLEQTVLAMRRVLERLKSENKCLKDAKGPLPKDAYDKLRVECGKVQHLYSEALDKISALQIELEIQTGQCVHCKNRIHKSDNASFESNKDIAESTDPNDLKEKLIKKTQLLEKAKILLSRAAAKEKQYREQIFHWKKRCSELQNVPIIQEEPPLH